MLKSLRIQTVGHYTSKREREREHPHHVQLVLSCSLLQLRSWLLANSEDERKSPPVTTTQNLHVRKPRGSTMRREDQQLYDNAIGKVNN